MMVQESLERITERWKQAFGQYEALRTQALPAVVRWEWANGERYSLLPYYFQRYPGRAHALKEPPSQPGYYIHYGFDMQGRVCMHRFYDYMKPEGLTVLEHDHRRSFARDDLSETYYSYQDQLTEVIEYSIPPRIPLHIQQIFYQDGRVIRHASLRLNGYTPLYSDKGADPDALYEWLGYNGRFRKVEEYIYEGERLEKILVYHESPGLQPFHAEEHCAYSEDGKLNRIDRVFKDGERWLVYRRREKGQTFSTIRKAAVAKLVAAIVERIRSQDIRGRVCLVELSYRSADHHFPPYIVVGLEADRQRLLESGRPEDRFALFAPILYPRAQRLEIRDPETLEICSQLEQEVQAVMKWDAAARTLRETAAALTQSDWGGIIDTTEDFAVFAIDWEAEADQLEEVLRASVPAEQVHEWKQKGWL